jgi:hypothetical protein
MQGYWKKYVDNGTLTSGQFKTGEGHFTDEFKKPNYPIFSNPSKYSGDSGNVECAHLVIWQRRYCARTCFCGII